MKPLQAGTMPAHYAKPVEDSILYNPYAIPKPLTGLRKFTNWYIVRPEKVHHLRDRTPFTNMLAGYVSVKSWHPYGFLESNFYQAWPTNFFKKHCKDVSSFQAYFADSK